MKLITRSEIRSQTMILYAGAISLMVMMMALGIDWGHIYMHDARLSRAIDSAVLMGVQNGAAGHAAVSEAMRQIAVANYSKLGDLTNSAAVYSASSAKVDPLTGGTYFEHIYKYGTDDGVNSFMSNVIQVGSKGEVNAAFTYANTDVHTFFLPVSGGMSKMVIRGKGTAQRRPRLIAIVLDRSGSMENNGGYTNLPGAVTNFLSQFDTNSDLISISSFASEARLDMAMTSNFWARGTNAMDTNTSSTYKGGIRFENYTVAPEGLRMGIETLYYGDTNAWNDPNTLKFLVFFTDGQFNGFRSLGFAPGFTNVLVGPPASAWTNDVRGTTNAFPRQTTNSDFVSDSSTLRFHATNVITTNEAASSKYFTNVWVTNWPGSVTYLMETKLYSAGSLSTNSTLSTNFYRTNSIQLNADNAVNFYYTNKGSPVSMTNPTVVVSNFISYTTNRMATLVRLKANQHLVQFHPGYTNLDMIVNGSVTFNGLPHFYWTNHQTNDYPQVNIWRNNSGTSTSDRFTNMLQWDPLASANNFTNGFLYYTNGGWSPLFTNMRSTNLLGVPFTNGMTTFSMNGDVYQNRTMYFDAASGAYTLTSGIYTNTSGNFQSNVFTNMIVVRKITNSGAGTGIDQLASFVREPSSNQLYILPMGFSSRPLTVYCMSSNGYVQPNATNYYSTTNLYTNQSWWEEEADRVASNICWQARLSNVTVFTVGFAGSSSNILINLANDTRYSGYQSTQPEGAYYYATNGADITNKFKAISERIRAVLTE